MRCKHAANRDLRLLPMVLPLQNPEEEQRARRRRLLSAAQSARIRRGMIRYVQVVLDLSRAASLSGEARTPSMP